jgi:hypothetical protein
MLRAAGMKLAIVYAFLCKDRDRHGNVRYYFRRDGKKTRIRARPGTLEFQTEYDAFLEASNSSKCVARNKRRIAFTRTFPASGKSRLRSRSTRTAFVLILLIGKSAKVSFAPGAMRSAHVCSSTCRRTCCVFGSSCLKSALSSGGSAAACGHLSRARRRGSSKRQCKQLIDFGKVREAADWLAKCSHERAPGAPLVAATFIRKHRVPGRTGSTEVIERTHKFLEP